VACGVAVLTTIDPLVRTLSPDALESARENSRLLIELERQRAKEEIEQVRQEQHRELARERQRMAEEIARAQGAPPDSTPERPAGPVLPNPVPSESPVRGAPEEQPRRQEAEEPPSLSTPSTPSPPQPGASTAPPQPPPSPPPTAPNRLVEDDDVKVEPFYEEPLPSFWGDSEIPEPPPVSGEPLELSKEERSALLKGGTESLGQVVLEAEAKWNVRAGFLLCLMGIESFAGGRGLRAAGATLLLPTEGDDLQRDNPYDLNARVLSSAERLDAMLREFGEDTGRAVAAFWAGRDVVGNLDASGEFPEALPEAIRGFAADVSSACGPARP
jgi:hypothetical protein